MLRSTPILASFRTRLLLTGIGLAPLPAQSRLHVDAANPSPGAGTTWSTAFTTLQPALAAATSGTEIWIARGTYTGGFTVPPGVRLLGGFSAGMERSTERGAHTLATILDGGGTQRVLVLGDQALLDGLVVQNGRGAAPGGGGAWIQGGSPVIRNCVFRDNTNQGGAGSTLHVGGGANPLVENTLFVRNAIPGSSHVIEITASKGTFTNLVVADNVNNGIHITAGAAPTIVNSIFANNTGRGICDIAASDTMVLENNLFFGNVVSLYFFRGTDYRTLAQVNALPYAKANLAFDPRFLAPATFDYRLPGDSLAAEAGTAQRYGSALHDAWGNSRVADADFDGVARGDIGAHELANATLTVTGTPQPGGTLVATLGGRPGALAALALGTAATPQLVLPLGTFALAPAPLVVLGLGTLPASTSLPIPTSVRGAVGFTGFAASGAGGALTNLVDLTIR